MKYLDLPDEFDKRQLLRMQDLLNRDHYSQGQLGELASALLALRDLFHWHDPDWDFHFTDNVATFDSCSTASPEQIQIMGDRFEQVVQETLDKQRQLVQDGLNRCKATETEE